MIFAILYFQDRATDARNDAQDRHDDQVTIARSEYIQDVFEYNLKLYAHNDCLRAVSFREDTRANWLSLADELDKRWGESVVDLTTKIRDNTDSNTPILYKEDCPPEPVKPAMPAILIIENGNAD